MQPVKDFLVIFYHIITPVQMSLTNINFFWLKQEYISFVSFLYHSPNNFIYLLCISLITFFIINRCMESDIPFSSHTPIDSEAL